MLGSTCNRHRILRAEHIIRDLHHYQTQFTIYCMNQAYDNTVLKHQLATAKWSIGLEGQIYSFITIGSCVVCALVYKTKHGLFLVSVSPTDTQFTNAMSPGNVLGQSVREPCEQQPRL